MVSTDDHSNDAEELEVMLSRIQHIIVDYVQKGQEQLVPVVNYHTPEELYKLFDFTLPNKGVGLEGIFKTINSTLEYSVNSWNPRFLDKLYAGTNPIGVISELLLAVLNSNAHVFHVSPVLSLMEIEVTKAIGQLLNMGEKAGGILCPGGSASNLLAMITARNKLFPSIKTEGYFPRPFHPQSKYGKLKVFTSIHSHYSIDKAVQVLGLGLDNIVKVPVDHEGRMQVDVLEKLIELSVQKDETPFFINATAGTTVLGAFDPIKDIAMIAKKYHCWLHVDGSWGGSVAFSDKVMKTTSWLEGSDHADTFTLNPHKLLGVPLQCSMLLTPHEGHLLFAKSNSSQADYLFHGNEYDIGAGTIGCGRRPDATKMFMAWKYYGKDGLGGRVDKALSLASQFTSMVRERKGFKLVQDPSPFLQICFWFVPPTIEKYVESLKGKEYSLCLSRITKHLHQQIREKGEILVDHSPLEGIPDFFRVVINAPTLSLHRDLERLLDVIEEVNASVDWSELL